MRIESGPYVGPRPFEREDQACFFGREHETRELCSLVIGHPLMLLYASSGTGKTSLLNAGLIPRLEEEGFDVFPLARVRGSIPADINTEEISNLYVFNTLMSWVLEDSSPQSVIGLSIKDFLKVRTPSGETEDGGTATILIFDQFEELFSFYPERRKDREDFFIQLRDALDSIPLLRVVIVIREDYLAHIDAYAHLLPDQLRNRFRLEGMGEAAALSAVTGPLQNTGCTFVPGVAENLVKELLRVKLETASGNTEVITGEVVEPVQLQVVCQSLWRELPQNMTEITLDHLHAFGDVNQALADFYQKAVAEAVHVTQVPEGALRLWFENKLITPAGTRGTVFKGKEETDGIPNHAVDVLEALHVIRGEWRSGARWYEITHDRFIEPIQAANRKWLKEHWEVEQERQRLEKLAEQWIRLGRGQGGLLDEVELLEVERSLKTFNAAELSLSEDISALMQASKTAIDEAKQEKEAARQREMAQAQALAEAEAARAKVATRAAQKARRFALGLAVCLILTIVVSWWAIHTLSISLKQKRILFSGEFAAAAREELRQDPELSVLLALQAVAQTYTPDKMVPPAAEKVIHWAIQASRMRLTLAGHTDGVVSGVYSPDGMRIATGSWDGTAKIWDSVSGRELLSFSNPTVIRGWLGVELLAVPEVLIRDLGLPEHSGVYIKQVFAGDPAEKAGIQTGDIIVKVGEQGVNVENFVQEISTKTPGTSVEIELIRDRKTITLSVNLLGKQKKPSFFSVVFSPDGKFLATTGDDQAVRIWDTATGEESFSFPEQKVNFISVAFSRDGKHLVVVSPDDQDGVLKVWNLDSRKVHLDLTGRCGQVSRVVFSPDGTLLVTAGAKGVVKFWDVKTGEDLLTLTAHGDADIYSIAFSPDGTKLATAGRDVTAKLWDIEYDKEMRPFSVKEARSFSGHTNTIIDVAFSPDGTRLATAGYDNVVKIRDIESGREIFTLSGHKNMIADVDFSPDGSRLVTASQDGTARVWEMALDRELPTLSGHTDDVVNVAFSPDGSRLATGSKDGTAKVFDSESGKELHTLSGHEGIVSGIAFSADGKSLATSGSDHTIKIWDVSSGMKVQTLQGHSAWAYRVVFSPDGKRLASVSGDHTAKVWELESGKELLTLSGHTAEVFGIAFSSDGNRIATTSRDGWTFVWDAQSGKVLLPIPSHSLWFQDISFSPDGSRIAAAGRGGEAKVWDLPSGKESLTLSSRNSQLMSIVFSPDGKRLATSGMGGSVEVWDAESGGKVFSVRDLGNEVYGLAFSPDSKILAVPGNDKKVHLFALDVETLLALARDRVSRSLTDEECGKYLDMKECPASAKALSKFISARMLARADDIEGAAADFRSALDLDPSMNIDPAKEAKRYAAEARKEKGLGYARFLDVERAVELLQKAKDLQPSLDLDPQTEAGRLAAPGFVAKGWRLAMNGKIGPAIGAYKKAQSLDADFLIPGESWNALCWYGALYRHASDVMFACDQAVTLEPTGPIRDSRGVARALTGDNQGAIEDFQAYVDSSEHEELKAKRKRWIAALQAGKNPFDADELEELSREQGM